AEGLDLVETEFATRLAAACFAVASDPDVSAAAVPARSLIGSANQCAGAGNFFLVDVVTRGYFGEEKTFWPYDICRWDTQLRHRGAAKLNRLIATGLMHGQEGNPILRHGGAEHVTDARGRGCNRRRLDPEFVCGVVSIDTFRGAIGNHLFNGPDHVRHLVTRVIHLFEWFAFERAGERGRKEELPVITAELVLVAEVEHTPALPVVFFALIRGPDECAFAEDIRDNERLDFAKRIHVHGIGNDEPVVPIDEAEFRENEEERVGRLCIEPAEVDLAVFHFPETRAGHSFE